MHLPASQTKHAPFAVEDTTLSAYLNLEKLPLVNTFTIFVTLKLIV
jgi:hypothetical protein